MSTSLPPLPSQKASEAALECEKLADTQESKPSNPWIIFFIVVLIAGFSGGMVGGFVVAMTTSTPTKVEAPLPHGNILDESGFNANR